MSDAAALAIVAAIATLAGIGYCIGYGIAQWRGACAVRSGGRTGPHRGRAASREAASLQAASREAAPLRDAPLPSAPDEQTPRAAPLDSDAVLEALRDVIDPELGHDIVALGLIYGLDVRDGLVTVTMTMTTPGCPAQDYIVSGVQKRCRRLPGVDDVRVDLVWDPPWSPQKMSSVARAQSGIPG